MAPESRMGGRLKEIPDTQPSVPREQGSRLSAPRAPSRKKSKPSLASSRGSSQPVQATHARLASVASSNTVASPRGEAAALLDDLRVSPGLPQADEEPPAPSPHDVPVSPDDEAVADYWYALSHVGGVFRLDSSKYVFQDWDIDAALFKTGVYVHLTRQERAPGLHGHSCTCPQWKAVHTCLHEQTLRIHASRLELLPFVAPVPLGPAVFLHKTPFRDVYVYSCVSSDGRYESGKRVIVTYQRDGRWHCQSCRYSPDCKHIPHAIEHATLIGFLPSSGTRSTPSAEGDDDEQEGTLLMNVGGLDRQKHGCISFQNIPAPRWCALPQEDTQSIAPPPMTTVHFALDSLSRCSCGTTLQSLQTARLPSRTTIRAVLYGLTVRSEVHIEVVPCPACHHHRRWIGPDLGSTGVFNWNNSILFTHELLNAYTISFTASETPFSAFCLSVRRHYEDHGAGLRFCSDETFVRAWFAFVQLQNIGSTMSCPTCGSSPSVVIADGVSLATRASKLTPGVRPPTSVDSTSERVKTISSYKARGLPAIPQRDIRSIVNKFLDTVSVSTAPSVAQPPAFPNLSKVTEKYPEMGAFLELIATTASSATPLLRKAYREFARQITAPDIVLQLVPYSAVKHLRELADQGTVVGWLQALVPALGRVLEVLRETRPAGEPLPGEIRGVARWLAERAEEVYTRLAQHDPAGPRQPQASEDWRVTGTCYGLPAVRARRVYTKLRHDADATGVDAEEMGECNKFFKTYSRNNLAGGILVLWCTHSICLGFHTIPVAEGRNDVFSAIYTRFPNAPEIIIYDFACQLAPYCLVREARYFANTRFLIDELHARDHTKCGQACFSSNSMQYDERIRGINTSAAECGNKGVGRIRKSVSYMTYEHAVIYTKVFMDIWNRTRVRKMTETGALR